MTYNLIINEEASSDALNAYLYYENKSYGLGDRFLNALQESYNYIAKDPQHYSYVYADKEKTMRDTKVKDFPFLVIYDTVGQDVIVYAVRNTYQNAKEY